MDLGAFRHGLGGAPIGNLGTVVSHDDALGAIAAAWSAGVRYFDTAPHYGVGLSERRLGQGLAGLPRDELVVSTKVGRVLVPNTAADSDREVVDEGFVVRPTSRRVRD